MMRISVHAEGISVWTVFFMRRLTKNLCVCLMIVFFFWFGTLVLDREILGTELIRLHIAADSDSVGNHQILQRAQSAILKSLEEELGNVSDIKQAEEYLRQKLPYIRSLAETVLEELGCGDTVRVDLCREASYERTSDFWILPAGVYQSLRVVIGDGVGESLWSVVYPDASCEGTGTQKNAVSVDSEVPESLPNFLAAGEEYGLRLIALDILGRLQNLLFRA